jgi:ubiquinone/menaquinone biosynthesis C-methylase UbiE/N-acetylglutamate synthase-like GNAT family acetyltransferase
MNSEKEIKEMVKEKYGAIAEQSKEQNQSSCCGSGCGCSNVEFSIMADDYAKLPGYVPDADLALGCGLPTEFARIKPGDTVVDLGSGAGNDCFVARSVVGESGRVIGIDMTEAMIAKAKANAAKLGFKNVEFKLGDIDAMPIADNTADVVVSNCVMNLVPNKQKAFSETYRIIKKGGHFSISDIVLQGELPDDLRKEAALYAGCISGAVQKEEYLQIIKDAGFVKSKIQKERKIEIPNEILSKFLSVDQLRAYKNSHIGVLSITVYAEKPLNYRFRRATEEDSAAIRSLLESQKLPTETVGTTKTDFYLAVENNAIVGVAGFEYYGEEVLLRSVAVPASLQKKHRGSELVDWMIALAKQKGLKRIVLLTETASKFFAKKGFIMVERSFIVNETMKQSSQFSGGCCSSAVCMELDL